MLKKENTSKHGIGRLFVKTSSVALKTAFISRFVGKFAPSEHTGVSSSDNTLNGASGMNIAWVTEIGKFAANQSHVVMFFLI